MLARIFELVAITDEFGKYISKKRYRTETEPIY